MVSARIMKRALLVTILISGFIFISFDCSVSAQEAGWQELMAKNVEGVAAVKNNDLAKAKEEAIKDALLKAVAEAETDLFGEGAALSKFRQPNAERYVRSFRILGEKQESGVFTVAASVIVDAALLIGDNRARTPKQARKRIALIVRGITNYAEYGRIRDYLETQVRYCGRLVPTMIAGHSATFNVDICESPQVFAGSLGRLAPVALNIKRTAADTIEVELPGK
jgi:hypothetical protein